MVPLPAAPQLLSLSAIASASKGNKKNYPCSPCHGEEACSQEICWILGDAQLERKVSTHRGAFWGSWGAEEGLSFSKDTEAGGEEQPPQCPCPGAVPVSCSALEQPPAGLDSHLISSAVCISTQRISPSQRGLCALDTPNPPLRRGMETDPRAPPGQLSSIPHTNSPFALSTERLHTIPESWSLERSLK